jgi:CubicO group peptidase (beta-lactamase class C family)
LIKEDAYPSFSYEQLPPHLFNNFINTENEEQNYSKTVEISNIFLGKTPNKTMKNQINILLKEACERGLAQGVYSGVSAAVSVIKNKVRYRGEFSGGLTRSDQSSLPVEVSTPFDLASLTKPLCTTLCTLHLIASGKMHWDYTTLALLDIALPQDKKSIMIRDILTHSSGLPAYIPYFREFNPQSSKDNMYPILQKIVKEPLQYSRGATCLYSDLGFILLGLLLEKLAQIPLDQLYRKRIIEPLNLTEKFFLCHHTVRYKQKKPRWRQPKTVLGGKESCKGRCMMSIAGLWAGLQATRDYLGPLAAY